MCSSQEQLEFAFNPSIDAGDFAKLWKGELQKAKDLLNELEKPIATGAEAILAFINLIDEFDFVTKGSFDVTGSYKRYTSDEALLKESQEARRAFHALLVTAKCSSAFSLNMEAVGQADVELDKDIARLVMLWKDSLRNGGADLVYEQKAKVLRLTLALDELENTFRDNLKKDNLRLLLPLEELQGLPREWLDSHMSQDHRGLFSVSRKKSDVMPVLTYCSLQKTREKAFRHLHNMATDNGPVLEKILRLRQEKAEALGFTNWAAYAIEGTMLNTPDNVKTFLGDVQKVVDPLADKEMEMYKQLLAEEGCSDFHIWDLEYGQTLLKKSVLPDPGPASEYFPVERVVPAMRDLIVKLFNLRFEEMRGLATWDPRVEAYKVYDKTNGEELLGRIFFDVYARDGKEDGAYTTTMRRPVINRQLGEVVLCTSFSSAPGACMSHREMTDMLHELGHCVHVLVAKQRYAKFAGNANCEADFVEVPSQLLELWLEDSRTLDFARNKEGDRIPEETLNRLLQMEEIGKATRQRKDLVYSQLSVS
jgi:Zn-dependent oligopeptidase